MMETENGDLKKKFSDGDRGVGGTRYPVSGMC
jgi:hypothetical protein